MVSNILGGNEMALNGKAMVKYHNDMNNIFLKGFKRNELILFFSILSQMSFAGQEEKRFSKEWLIELTKWNGKNKAYFSKTLDELCKKMIIMYARIDNKKIRGYITLFETAVVDKDTQEIVVTLTTRGAELFTNLKLGKWTLWELEEYISYKSAYTMEFFRRIRQYSCRDTATGKYWWEVSLEEFKELMGVPKKQSSGYVKEKVLAPILKELEDKYQLEIIPLAPKKKNGRPAVTGYKFYFKYEPYSFNEIKQMEKEYSKDLIDVTPLAIEVYEMDNYIPDESQIEYQSDYIPDVPKDTDSAGDSTPPTKIVKSTGKSYEPLKSTMYHSEEFKERYEYFLRMRFEKKRKNTEFEQKMILEKLHKAGNENEALEMLTNAILGGHTNVVPINNGKNSKRTSDDEYKWEYEESTYHRLLREKREREGYQEPEIEDDPNDDFPF